MYCIVSYGFEKKYLAFQNTDDEVQFGYYLADRDTFIMNLSNNKKDHPTLFKTAEKAEDFIKWISSVRCEYRFSYYNLNYEKIDSYSIPKCDMDCWKCNKKNKYRCRHLKNPYQNCCGFIMAKFEDDFKPDEKRLDAPCERCLTKGCVYNMNYR